MHRFSPSILAIEVETLLHAISDPRQTPWLDRLTDYANANLIEIALLSASGDQETIDQAINLANLTPVAIIDLPACTIRVRSDDTWQPLDADSSDPTVLVQQWLNQHSARSQQFVISIAATPENTLTTKLACSFDSVVLPSLPPQAAAELYRHHRIAQTQNKLFRANQPGLQGVFEGLHWFDALPPGATEHSAPTATHLGAFSKTRTQARVAVKCWAQAVDLVIDHNGWKRSVPMARQDDRTFIADVDRFSPGDRYAFAISQNHDKLYPDPRSRSHPEGVHGFSQLTGPSCFAWQDDNWRGVSKQDLVIYELHVGTATQKGTFAAAVELIPGLVELGVTAIELLPVAQSAGRWNWGYDGVNLFAPHHPYGSADDLKSLVNACHQAGVAVVLDVVYNHPGPEGNYLAPFGPYFSTRHHTPWGPAYNFDGPDRKLCRQWVVDNVLHWLDEFHVDGLRLDAIHFMFDDSQQSIVAQISQAVRDFEKKRNFPALLIGETNVFDGSMIKPTSEGGLGFDAIWCDDLMHSIYSLGSPETQLTDRTYHQHADVANALSHGFLFQGPPVERADHANFQPIDRQQMHSLVVALQTHDSVGNHPLGKRMHHLTSFNFQQAAAALTLLSPAIPMLFMGDETLEPHSFHYFVDFHDPSLRSAIARSRRHEHPQQDWTAAISPLNEAAFRSSKLTPIESSVNAEQRSRMKKWYRDLLQIRREWTKAGVLKAEHLRVNFVPEQLLFQLSYDAGRQQRGLIVRLADPREVDKFAAVPIALKGTALLSSVSDVAGTEYSLAINQALIISGSANIATQTETTE